VLVALRQGADGGVCIELQQQHYGPGIGWFNQRSLVIDPHQWQQLQSLLGHTSGAAVLTAAADRPREVIPFPGPRDTTTPRPASGTL
jgi:hypothetical protein